MPAGQSSSLGDRVARQFEAQFKRPADPADPEFAAYVKTALPQMVADDRAARLRSQGRWHTADKFAYAAAAIPFGAAALSPLMAGGTPMATMGSSPLIAPSATAGAIPYAGGMGVAPLAGGAASTMPAGWTPGWEGASNIIGGGGGGVNNVAPAAGSWLSRNVTGRDLAALGTGAINAATGIYGANQANNAAREAAAAQAAQYERTQKFLEEQQKQQHDDYLAWIEEQRRQFDTTELNKEPYREFGKANMTRMNAMMDQPKPQRPNYQPRFTS